jgi:hypothetical protein
MPGRASAKDNARLAGLTRPVMTITGKLRSVRASALSTSSPVIPCNIWEWRPIGAGITENSEDLLHNGQSLGRYARPELRSASTRSHNTPKSAKGLAQAFVCGSDWAKINQKSRLNVTP